MPLPWAAAGTSYGFSPAGAAEPWLPQPLVYGFYAADRQDGVPGSTLELYRALLRLRRELDLGVGTLEWLDSLGGMPLPSQVLAFRSVHPGREPVTVVCSLAEEPVELPEGAEVLVCSGVLHHGRIHRDTTVWLR